MANLSNKQINQLKQEFLALDENGDGTIATEELGKLLRAGKSKKNKLSEEDIAKILSDFDKDDSGTIEVYEFLGAITSRKHRDTVLKAFTNRSAIRKQFAKLDEDNDGEITRKEFQKCLEKCSKTKVTEEQMDRIMKEYDPNGDGKLNFDEFIDAMSI